jgi:hypothetical protein
MSTIVPVSVGGWLISSHISSKISGFARPPFKWAPPEGQRVNRKLPLIDHRTLSHHGRLAHCRPIPAIAARKCPLYVLPARIYRQVCPAERVFVIRDHNDCAIYRRFIEFIRSPPYNFRFHTIISDKPLEFINASCVMMPVGVGRLGLREFPT